MLLLMLMCGAVLYKRGPPFYHASYSVIVRKVSTDLSTPTDLPSPTEVPTSWTWLSALNRVTQQVSKVITIVLCVSRLHSVTVLCVLICATLPSSGRGIQPCAVQL